MDVKIFALKFDTKGYYAKVPDYLTCEAPAGPCPKNCSSLWQAGKCVNYARLSQNFFPDTLFSINQVNLCMCACVNNENRTRKQGKAYRSRVGINKTMFGSKKHDGMGLCCIYVGTPNYPADYLNLCSVIDNRMVENAPSKEVCVVQYTQECSSNWKGQKCTIGVYLLENFSPNTPLSIKCTNLPMSAKANIKNGAGESSKAIVKDSNVISARFNVQNAHCMDATNITGKFNKVSNWSLNNDIHYIRAMDRNDVAIISIVAKGTRSGNLVKGTSNYAICAYTFGNFFSRMKFNVDCSSPQGCMKTNKEEPHKKSRNIRSGHTNVIKARFNTGKDYRAELRSKYGLAVRIKNYANFHIVKQSQDGGIVSPS